MSLGGHVVCTNYITAVYSCFEYVPQTDSSHLLYPGNSSAAPLLKVAYSGCINNICSVHNVAEYKFHSCVSCTTTQSTVLGYNH